MEISRKLGVSYDPLRVESPLEGDVFYYQDGVVPYLRLKVSHCSRTWVFDAAFGKRHIKRQIGKAEMLGLPEARMRAYEWRKLLEEGKAPPTVQSRTKEAVSRLAKVESLFNEYHAKHLRLRAATCDEAMRNFQRYWTPVRGLHASDLTPRIVQGWLAQIAEHNGRATANKQRTLLQSMMRWNAAHGAIPMPAELFLAVKPYKEQPRTAYLRQGEEVTRLSAALDEETKDVRDAVWLLLFTGQRKSNVLAMEWSEIDWEQKLWTIPAHKTKPGRDLFVPITPKALELLEGRRNDSNYVFPACRAARQGHLKYINKAWLRIRDKAELPAKLTLHGLRHTVGTWLAQQGAEAFEIARALNHSNVRTSQIYVHMAAIDVRDKLSKLQEAI